MRMRAWCSGTAPAPAWRIRSWPPWRTASRSEHRHAALPVPLHGTRIEAAGSAGSSRRPRCAPPSPRRRARCRGLPLFAGGKSFGGRMTSQAQAAQAAARRRGLAFLGFPLHPAGKPSDERAPPISSVRVPMLFLQGTRDALAELALLRPVAKAWAPCDAAPDRRCRSLVPRARPVRAQRCAGARGDARPGGGLDKRPGMTRRDRGGAHWREPRGVGRPGNCQNRPDAATQRRPRALRRSHSSWRHHEPPLPANRRAARRPRLRRRRCAQNISIATGGTGGVYYPMGGGIADVLSKHVPGMQATAEVTGGSVDNLKLIGTGKPYIGFTMADAGLDALPRRGQVQGQQGAAAHADGAVPEPHARGHASRAAASTRWPT